MDKAIMDNKLNLASYACIIADVIREHFDGYELTEINARSDSAEVDFKMNGRNYRFMLARDKYKDDREVGENGENS